jgi:hypothetical protein
MSQVVESEIFNACTTTCCIPCALVINTHLPHRWSLSPTWTADVRSRLGGKDQRQLFNAAQRIQGKMQNQGIAAARDDALIIDCCLAKLKLKRPDEYDLIFDHYVKDVSKRAIGRRLKLSEGMVRIKFLMAEGFVEGCLSMLDIKLEMDDLL